MSILYFLAGLRTPVGNILMLAVTYLGSEIALMAGALIILWCVDKRWGYYLLLVSSWGTTLNQLLKNIFMIPRPWVKDPHFTIVEAARSGATGYSFPSGHTQSATGFFGGLARITDKRWLRILFIIIVLLVGLSRMYLGVHTPLDVGVSLLIGTVLVLVIYHFFKRDEHQLPVMLLGIVAALGTVIFMEIKTAGITTLDTLDADGLKNAYTCLGLALSIPVIYIIDQKYIRYPTQAVWWAQIIKCVIGCGLLIGIRYLLKEPLLTLTGGHASAHMIRYFIMAVVGGAVWPLTFRWFSRR